MGGLRLSRNIWLVSGLVLLSCVSACLPLNGQFSRLRDDDAVEIPDPVDGYQLVVTDTTRQHLICKRRNSSQLIADMTFKSAGRGEVKVGTFLSGHVAACETSRRAARNNIACVEKGYDYQAINVETGAQVRSFGRSLSACANFTQYQGAATASAGLDLIDPRDLAAYRRNLPQLADGHINGALHAEDTIWYDEDSMVFSYQDSFGNPTGPEGLRANRVAYDVGVTADSADIRALTEYFELQTFKYPFSIAAGRVDRGNAESVYFWSPPRDAQGRPLPVVWWKSGSHWNWVFPVGTVFGEVLLVRDAGAVSEWYVHEVRSRVRELDRWRTDIFRPFPRASDLSTAIKRQRPNWQRSDLRQLVSHLEDSSTLTPGRLDSKSYEKAVPSINGYYDNLPETKDYALIRELLVGTVFQSALNVEWKRHGDKVSFAASTLGNFHIVPKHYIAGLLANNEASCTRCHDQTGRPLGQLDYRTSLYGEIWGEDQIFTWHPFKVDDEIYSVSDGSRHPNPKMVAAGLLVERRGPPNDRNYREIRRPYPADYR
ncbi:MAG: hypothetical protein RIQ81_666 [Pseudomonadota bacterium]|jgi:hypothetical protein